MKIKEKKPNPITVKGIGKRGKNPYVEHNPTDTIQRPALYKESTVIDEQQIKVKAKSSKTGRTITHRFKSPQEAAQHYHKWLKSGKLRNVQLVSEISYDVLGALADKANDYSVHNQLIQEVYIRGLEDWSEDKPATKQQWAFARVNSFLEGGRALELDEDLITEAVYKITNKTSNKSLGRLARRKDSIGRQAKAELKRRLDAEKTSAYNNKGAASKKLQNALTGKTKITPAVATKLIKTLDINPKSAVAKSLNAVAKKTHEEKIIKKHVKKHLTSAEYQQQEKERKKAERAQKKEEQRLEAERLKNQKLTAKQEAARRREDEKAKQEAERIAGLVAAELAKHKAALVADNAVSIKKRASEEFRKKLKPRPQPDTGPVQKPKKGVLASVLGFLGKKKKARPAVSSSGRPLTPIEIAAMKDSE